jgi:hypothetical protein
MAGFLRSISCNSSSATSLTPPFACHVHVSIRIRIKIQPYAERMRRTVTRISMCCSWQDTRRLRFHTETKPSVLEGVNGNASIAMQLSKRQPTYFHYTNTISMFKNVSETSSTTWVHETAPIWRASASTRCIVQGPHQLELA